jgi:hypothetical protein
MTLEKDLEVFLDFSHGKKEKQHNPAGILDISIGGLVGIHVISGNSDERPKIFTF